MNKMVETINKCCGIDKKSTITLMRHQDKDGQSQFFFYFYFGQLCSPEELRMEYYLMHQLRLFVKEKMKDIERGAEEYGAYNAENYSYYFDDEFSVRWAEWLEANRTKIKTIWDKFTAAPYIHPFYFKLDAPIFGRSVHNKIMELGGDYVTVAFSKNKINIADKATKTLISENVNYMMNVYMRENFRLCKTVIVIDEINESLAHSWFPNQKICDAIAQNDMVFFFYKKNKSENRLVRTPYYFQSFKIGCE